GRQRTPRPSSARVGLPVLGRGPLGVPAQRGASFPTALVGVDQGVCQGGVLGVSATPWAPVVSVVAVVQGPARSCRPVMPGRPIRSVSGSAGPVVLVVGSW